MTIEIKRITWEPCIDLSKYALFDTDDTQEELRYCDFIEFVTSELIEKEIKDGELEVFCFVREEVDNHEFEFLDELIYSLDEEYGVDSSYGDFFRTVKDADLKRLKELEQVFIAELKKAYTPWLCRHVATVTVNVRAFIAVYPWIAKEIGGAK